jgi:hypothetical protein
LVGTLAAAWSGTEALLLYGHGGILERQTVSAAGQPSGASVPLGDTLAGELVVGGYAGATWADGRFAATWIEQNIPNSPPGGVYLAEFDADGSPHPAVTVWTASSSFELLYWPTVAWTGSDYRLAWSIGSDFYVTRVPRAGSPDPVAHFDIGYGEVELGPPAWDGTNFGALFARHSGSGFVFQRVAPDGSAVEAPIEVSTSSSNARVIWTGREYAVVWADRADTQTLWLTRIGTCP